MALDTPGLKGNLLDIVTEMRTRSEISDQEFCNLLGDAIETFVKSATINYISGLAAPNGPVTGTFNGQLE